MNVENAWVAPAGDGLVTLNEPVALVQGKGCVSDPGGIPGEILSDNEPSCSLYVDVSRGRVPALPGTGGVAMPSVPSE
jgi:hypothetical protein